MRWIRRWLRWILPGPSVARRPENPVDERLMQRIKAQGRSVNDILPVRGPKAVERERKRRELRDAYRAGDLDAVKALTKELAGR